MVRTPRAELCYRNLVRRFVDEILGDREPGYTFYNEARSQEIVNAVARSRFERRWVSLPLYAEETHSGLRKEDQPGDWRLVHP